jgi:K+-sensing histidine kinase KdpD
VDADVSLSMDILAFLLLVVAVALVGGLLPALLAAIGGFLLLNYFFTPPVRMFTIAERENLLALFAFLVVAVSVSTVVDVATQTRRRRRPEPRQPPCSPWRAACYAARARCRRCSSRSVRRSPSTP